MDFLPKEKGVTYLGHCSNSGLSSQHNLLESYLVFLANIKFTKILDSGATHHIVCDVNLLTNMKKVHGVHVEFPNENQLEITHTSIILYISLITWF